MNLFHKILPPRALLCYSLIPLGLQQLVHSMSWINRSEALLIPFDLFLLWWLANNWNNCSMAPIKVTVAIWFCKTEQDLNAKSNQWRINIGIRVHCCSDQWSSLPSLLQSSVIACTLALKSAELLKCPIWSESEITDFWTSYGRFGGAGKVKGGSSGIMWLLESGITVWMRWSKRCCDINVVPSYDQGWWASFHSNPKYQMRISSFTAFICCASFDSFE